MILEGSDFFVTKLCFVIYIKNWKPVFFSFNQFFKTQAQLFLQVYWGIFCAVACFFQNQMIQFFFLFTIPNVTLTSEFYNVPEIEFLSLMFIKKQT